MKLDYIISAIGIRITIVWMPETLAGSSISVASVVKTTYTITAPVNKCN